MYEWKFVYLYAHRSVLKNELNDTAGAQPNILDYTIEFYAKIYIFLNTSKGKELCSLLWIFNLCTFCTYLSI